MRVFVRSVVWKRFRVVLCVALCVVLYAGELSAVCECGAASYSGMLGGPQDVAGGDGGVVGQHVNLKFRRRAAVPGQRVNTC